MFKTIFKAYMIINFEIIIINQLYFFSIQGVALGEECRAKGVNVILGPAMVSFI